MDFRSANTENSERQNILNDIIDGTSMSFERSLSPETEEFNETDNDEVDRQELDASRKLLCKYMAAKAQLETLEKQVGSLSEEVENTSNTLRHQTFLLYAGDWLAGVRATVKGTEKVVQEELKKKIERALLDSGMDADTARELSKKHNAFATLKGEVVTTALGYLAPEMEKVKHATAPQTPHLDRLDALCKKANVSRSRFIEVMEWYSERNALAHHQPPSLAGSLKTDGTVDWNGIMEQCEEAKKMVGTIKDAGTINEAQKLDMIKIIDLWFGALVVGWKNGEAVLTEAGQIAVRDARKKVSDNEKKRKATDAVPFSSYKKGKWDDIASD
ncbi:hypothetical protein K4F52_003845 [Lecanicillium sp. MT-2017a]|nr:hypothetical protein K4F52_003845 [Lecanicillium sp. MT-2017a]